MPEYDVLVIGGGPGGLAAAIAAKKEDKRVLLIEREEKLGGILKQCIHDGFGILHFGEKLTGPEYVERFEEEFYQLHIDLVLQTFVTDLKKEETGFLVTAVNKEGLHKYKSKTLILATGCRERTAKQVSIHGTRPSGVFTAGTAQYFVNLLGEMPTKKCVILGSGDIGLIMARRLALEGACVEGVYEIKKEPSGLTRNLVQCLEDYGIPLHLSHTVTKVFGQDRLCGVEISKVDENFSPIAGTEKRVDCDALILSVGLIPENEIAEKLSVTLDSHTKGPICDNLFMTEVDGVFSCGNALHVNDLVDYVSESGELAGRAAAGYDVCWKPVKKKTVIETDSSLLYLVPQRLHPKEGKEKTVFYFRSRESLKTGTLCIDVDGKTVFKKKYRNLKPPEMERLELDTSPFSITPDSIVRVRIEKGDNSI